jgi:hypothetical protein
VFSERVPFPAGADVPDKEVEGNKDDDGERKGLIATEIVEDGIDGVDGTAGAGSQMECDCVLGKTVH